MIDPTIIVSIIATAGSVAIAFITHAKKKSLEKENKSLNETKELLEIEIKEIKLISTGMVVAYFFSFIKPLFDNISNLELTIIDGEKEYKINGENTKLELIIPKQLDKNSFEAASNYNKSFGVGEIKSNDGKTLYKQINYRIDKTLNEAVIFIDVPSILKSALRYYKIPMFESKKNLQDLLSREMNNFKSEINRMIENDELEGKVTILER